MEDSKKGSNLEKRRFLFLFGCIIVRFYVSHILYTKGGDTYLMSIIGVLMCCIGIGFWYIYWFDLRKTGAEVFGDIIWWNKLRPFHGLMYLLAGLSLFNERYKVYAWKIILMDTIVGLIKFLEYHYAN